MKHEHKSLKHKHSLFLLVVLVEIIQLKINIDMSAFLSYEIFVSFSAQMGVGEGKQVGQWFGPNTIAQVMRYDYTNSSSFSGLSFMYFVFLQLACLLTARLEHSMSDLGFEPGSVTMFSLVF